MSTEGIAWFLVIVLAAERRAQSLVEGQDRALPAGQRERAPQARLAPRQGNEEDGEEDVAC